MFHYRYTRIACTSGIAFVAGQRLLGIIIAAISPRRPPDSAFRSALHTGWNSGRQGRVPIPTLGQGASSCSQEDIQRVRVYLESGRVTASLPTRICGLTNSSEACLHSVSGDYATAGLATTGVVSNSDTIGKQDVNTAVNGTKSVHRDANSEPEVAARVHGSEPLMPRLSIRRRIDDGRRGTFHSI